MRENIKKLLIILLAILLLMTSCSAEEHEQTVVMQAEIVEISGYSLLVKVDENSPEAKCSDLFNVYTKDAEVEGTPEVGAVVEVTYNGIMQETYPASPCGVTKIVVKYN